jgi:hypothetical protein
MGGSSDRRSSDGAIAIVTGRSRNPSPRSLDHPIARWLGTVCVVAASKSLMDLIPRLLFVLGVGFFCANVRLLIQFIRFLKIRSSAVLTWPGRRPPFYGLLLAMGAILGLLVIYKLAFLHRHPADVFGESMMMLYYGYGVPLSLRIGRGFYEDGIWADGGFIRYRNIGGLTWREGERQVTLVLIYRMRQLARRLVVPESCYGAARRLLRDKIAAHDIHFTGKSLDLGVHDDRDDV